MLVFESLKAQVEGKPVTLSRARVPGGWLVLMTWTSRVIEHSNMAFVPDPEHTWNGASLPPGRQPAVG